MVKLNRQQYGKIGKYGKIKPSTKSSMLFKTGQMPEVNGNKLFCK